jgi:uncharacterized repeat protein (TIGR03803 family)
VATVLSWVVAALFGLSIANNTAQAQTYSTPYIFLGPPDGLNPEAGLIRDAVGNLYGTTTEGGTSNAGTVFKVDAAGKETILYSFLMDTGAPQTPLVRDSAGNLYGTAQGGTYGDGAVYELSITGKETTLYSFTGAGGDGRLTMAGVIRDKSGNLYGTTLSGGSGTCDCGTVFKLTKSGTETVLHSFTGAGVGGDGAEPYGGLVHDAAGNLYGTTVSGGDPSCNSGFGCGTVFKIDTAGMETVLYSFTGTGGDGAFPYATLILDASGNLYGTTEEGGSHTCKNSSGGTAGCGTVFKLSAAGKETVLHSFAGGKSGQAPIGGLLRDKLGNLFGTTTQGGIQGCNNGCGTVFKLSVAGTHIVLYRLTEGPSLGTLVRDAAGNFYGTTVSGGDGNGDVFKLTP